MKLFLFELNDQKKEQSKSDEFLLRLTEFDAEMSGINFTSCLRADLRNKYEVAKKKALENMKKILPRTSDGEEKMQLALKVCFNKILSIHLEIICVEHVKCPHHIKYLINITSLFTNIKLSKLVAL